MRFVEYVPPLVLSPNPMIRVNKKKQRCFEYRTVRILFSAFRLPKTFDRLQHSAEVFNTRIDENGLNGSADISGSIKYSSIDAFIYVYNITFENNNLMFISVMSLT